MKNSAQTAARLRFGDFEVDLHTGDLRKHGHRIRLQEKPFQILSHHNGVTKNFRPQF